MIELIPVKDQERLAAKLRRIGHRNVALDAALMEQVAGIIDDVRARGDAALVELQTERPTIKGGTSRKRRGGEGGAAVILQGTEHRIDVDVLIAGVPAAIVLNDVLALALEGSGLLHLLDGEAELWPGFHLFPTDGHTPGLQLLRLEGGGLLA